MTIKVECYFDRMMAEWDVVCAEWPDEKADRFASEWQALCDAGAEWVEVVSLGGRLVAYPSEDIVRFCARWGIHP